MSDMTHYGKSPGGSAWLPIGGRRYGIPEHKLAGTVLWSWQDPRWSPRERAIVRLVDELHDTATLSDDLWAQLESSFERDQIVEPLVLVGFYHTISFVTDGLSIEPEHGGERFPLADSAA